MKIKCIEYKCKYYFNSDDYYEICQLINKPIFYRCYALSEIPNKKEEIACKIAKLTQELDKLDELETFIKSNQ